MLPGSGVFDLDFGRKGDVRVMAAEGDLPVAAISGDRTTREARVSVRGQLRHGSSRKEDR
jgi:hypothetical protein